MKTPALLLSLLMLASAGMVSAQTTYRWVDERGQVHFSDQPPPASARQAEERRYSGSRADTVPSYTERKLNEDFPVTLYTADSCEDICVQARSLLDKRGISYTEIKLVTEEDLEKYRAIFGSPEEVPALTVGSQPFKGFGPESWNRLLDTAGYPRTLPPRN